MAFWKSQPASRLGRSIVTAYTTTLTNATQSTTGFSAQTYQCGLFIILALVFGQPSTRQPRTLLPTALPFCFQPEIQNIL
jgi:hypothetical protein